MATRKTPGLPPGVFYRRLFVYSSIRWIPANYSTPPIKKAVDTAFFIMPDMTKP